MKKRMVEFDTDYGKSMLWNNLWGLGSPGIPGWERAKKACEEAETARWAFASFYALGFTYRDLAIHRMLTDIETPQDAVDRLRAQLQTDWPQESGP